jgi:hypothetical protein
VAYRVQVSILDLGGIYSNGLPSLVGTLTTSVVAGQLTPGISTTGTSNPSPFVISFPGSANPPPLPGHLLVTDAGGPGDFFRSGPLTGWPAEPVVLMAGTKVESISFDVLATQISMPLSTDLPWLAWVGGGLGTLLTFIPFNITVKKITLLASPVAGSIRARFSGTIGYFTFFVPRRSDMYGEVDVTISPSGDATSPTAIVTATASNLSLSADNIFLLVSPLLSAIAPLFSSSLSGPLTKAVNSAIVSTLSKMAIPVVSGKPVFSAAATASARRISVLQSGVVIQAILSELSAVPATPATPPSVAPQMVVSINPQPSMDVAMTYMVNVREASNGAPIPSAAVSIKTYAQITGASSVATGQTDAHGQVAIASTLRPRVRPSTSPTSTGTMITTWPLLTVNKAGFQTYTRELTGSP